MHGIIDCPFCEGRDITEEGFEESHCWGHDFERYEMRCNGCGAEWLLSYEDGDWFVEGDIEEAA
jgi:hypothetical protein